MSTFMIRSVAQSVLMYPETLVRLTDRLVSDIGKRRYKSHTTKHHVCIMPSVCELVYKPKSIKRPVGRLELYAR